MRGAIQAFLVVGVVGLTANVRADDADQARAVVEDAIRAQGGMDRLARAASMTRAFKGDIASFTTGVPCSGEISYQLPDQCRWSFIVESSGQKGTLQHAIVRDKGWRASNGGAPKDLTQQEIDEYRQRAYTMWLFTLAPLTQERTFTLAPVPPTTVAGNAAVGVKVTAKDRPEVKLYFDKGTHLLVKAEWKGKYLNIDGLHEFYFSDHKEFDGVKLPTHQLENFEGKKTAEWNFTTNKFIEKFEEGTFTRP
jgi:hypothetical protein